jgi:hypothetical protein
VLLLGGHSLSSAQGALPDIIGIRPGMPVQEALKILRAHDPKAPLTLGQATLPELGSKPAPSLLHLNVGQGLDIIAVHITLPPNEQVVWGVARKLRFQDGKEMLRDPLLTSLRQKYGMETFSNLPGGLIWLSSKTQSIDVPTMKSQNCGGNTWEVSGFREGTIQEPQVVEAGSPLIAQRFGRPACDNLTAVKVNLDYALGAGTGRDEIRTMSISIVDGELADRAKRVTDAAIAKVGQEKSDRERQQRQQQAPPKL